MGGAVSGTTNEACRRVNLTQAPRLHETRTQENWGGPDGTHAIGVGHGS